MADLFFYGTLCHVPLLARVLEREAGDLAPEAAILPGWAVHWVEGECFPMILAREGAEAQGVLMRGLDETDLARLDHYEGGFGYALEPLPVRTEAGETVEARVFLPDPSLWTPGAPWRLEDWVARYGAMTMEAADEVMGRFGSTSAAGIGKLFPWIRARAWARVMAQDTAPCTLRDGPRPDDFRIEALRPGFDGFFRLQAFDLSYRRFDGSQSEVFPREAFVAFDAALVLPYDPETDRVLLIEQLRFGPIWRKDAAVRVLEPVAGLVEAGEDPADCARREAEEEAGLVLGDLRPMTKVYASPGYSTEFFHCYLGLCSLDGNGGGIVGVEAEHEDIRSHVISFDRAMALVDSGEVNAGPLCLMLLWLARHREELRRGGASARP